MRGAQLCIIFVLVALYLSAGAHQDKTQAEPSPKKYEPAIDQIKKAVAFLQGDFEATGTSVVDGVPTPFRERRRTNATGFFLRVPEPRAGEDLGIVYLVTNRHAIRVPSADGRGEGPYFKSLAIRINLRRPEPDGTQFRKANVDVTDGRGCLTWLTHPDETVDLALVPIQLNPDTVDFKYIGTDLLATADILKKHSIDENDEVLFAGLFAWHLGANKNYPIVRHGKISRLSEKRIPLDLLNPDRTAELHLADVMSFGGNSGSPVFVRIGGVREGPSLAVGGYSYYLLGVMQGFFPEGLDFTIDVVQRRGSAAQNSGIAAVVPADKLVEVLETPRCRASRLHALGDFMTERNRRDEAEKCYLEAIKLLEQSAPRHTDLAVTLESYAALLKRAGRLGEARLIESRVRAISAVRCE